VFLYVFLGERAGCEGVDGDEHQGGAMAGTGPILEYGFTTAYDFFLLASIKF